MRGMQPRQEKMIVGERIHLVAPPSCFVGSYGLENMPLRKEDIVQEKSIHAKKLSIEVETSKVGRNK